MKVSYHVHEHDGGWAYRLGDTWSETLATHEQALQAARTAARRQELDGKDVTINYQNKSGEWVYENSAGGDRPATDVVDDK